jgi:hypothetical protein
MGCARQRLNCHHAATFWARSLAAHLTESVPARKEKPGDEPPPGNSWSQDLIRRAPSTAHASMATAASVPPRGSIV